MNAKPETTTYAPLTGAAREKALKEFERIKQGKKAHPEQKPRGLKIKIQEMEYCDWNPQSAKEVLLSLNPGHSEDDAKAYFDGDFRKAMLRNLRHEAQECPFYGLNPKFAWTACGRWWRAHTRRLHEAGLSWEAISNGLLVIEWFPYHSKRSALPRKPVCPSQEYSFQLAKEMLGSKIVVGMRSKKQWLMVDERVEDVPFLKNPQNPHISPANTPVELFERIIEALR